MIRRFVNFIVGSMGRSCSVPIITRCYSVLISRIRFFGSPVKLGIFIARPFWRSFGLLDFPLLGMCLQSPVRMSLGIYLRRLLGRLQLPIIVGGYLNIVTCLGVLVLVILGLLSISLMYFLLTIFAQELVWSLRLLGITTSFMMSLRQGC